MARFSNVVRGSYTILTAYCNLRIHYGTLDPMEQEVAESSPPVTTKSSRRKIFLLVGLIFTVLSVLLIVVFINVSSKDFEEEEIGDKNKIERIASTAQNAPDVELGEYILATTLPRLRTTANAYILKKQFTKEDVTQIAASLGLAQEESKDNRYFVFYDLDNQENRGIIQFDSHTGSFTYTSYGDSEKITSAGPVQTQAENILKTIGVGDEFTSCAITYRRIDTPNTTFVECHRDWTRLGAPLINLGGILNANEGVGLASVKVGQVDENAPGDAAVTGVSTGQNGRARPNDFNTATVAIRDGRVVSVVSNLRWLEAVEAQDLVTPQEALSLFQNKKAEFSLTIPAGQGVVDWEKVYPGNEARAGSAVIQDISLVYLDKPVAEPQEAYSPMYLIRGISKLESGYTVKFVQLVSAQKAAYSTSLLNSKVVAGTSTQLAQNRENLQLETFTPTGTVTVSPTVTQAPEVTSEPTTTITTTPSPAQNNYCANVSGNFTITLNVPGYGNISLASGVPLRANGAYENTIHTFYLKSANPSIDVTAIRNALHKRVEDQYVINVAEWIVEKQTEDHEPQPINSVATIKSTVFQRINDEGGGTDSGSLCSRGISNPRPAPHGNCASNILLKSEVMEGIAQRVAERIYNAAQSNKLSSEASKGDVFPASVNRNLQSVLADDPNESLGSTASEKCYVSGTSPVIFAYSPSSLSASVNLGSPVTYSDPSLQNNSWNFVSSVSGVLQVNNLLRDRMYYEYNSQAVTLNGSGKGYVVKSEELPGLAASISQKLGLNAAETQALSTELNNAKTDLGNAKFIKVELVSSGEIANKLPISVSPIPDTLHRIHFILSKSSKGAKLSAPTLTPLERFGFTIIELGASAR